MKDTDTELKKIFHSHLFSIFLLAFALRMLWFFIVLIKNPSGFMLYDSWSYWKIAENIDTVGIFSQGSGASLVPDSIRTPLYPLFIFLLRKFFFGLYGIILTQVLISSAAAAFCAFITEQIFTNKKAGIIAGIFLAIDFPSVFFANALMTETLFTFLLLTSFYFFISFFKGQKTNHLVVSGIFSGLAILCRPVAIYFPVIFAAAILFTKPVSSQSVLKFSGFSGMKRSLAFLFISYLVIAPWIFRNYHTFGSPFLSTVGDINLLSYTSAAIRSEKENKTLFEIQQEYKKFSAGNFNWEKKEEIVRFTEYCRQEGYGIIGIYPLTFLKNQAFSFASFFIKPLRSYIDVQLGMTEKYNSITGLPGKTMNISVEKIIGNTSSFALLIVLFQAVLLLVTAFFILAHFMAKNRKLTFPLRIAILVIFYFAFFSAFTETDARMRVPVMPFLSILAGSGAVLFAANARKNEK